MEENGGVLGGAWVEAGRGRMEVNAGLSAEVWGWICWGLKVCGGLNFRGKEEEEYAEFLQRRRKGILELSRSL